MKNQRIRQSGYQCGHHLLQVLALVLILAIWGTAESKPAKSSTLKIQAIGICGENCFKIRVAVINRSGHAIKVPTHGLINDWVVSQSAVEGQIQVQRISGYAFPSQSPHLHPCRLLRSGRSYSQVVVLDFRKATIPLHGKVSIETEYDSLSQADCGTNVLPEPLKSNSIPLVLK